MIKILGFSHPSFESCSLKDVFEYFEDKEWIDVDTETTGKSPHIHKIISLQLGDADNQFFIDCRAVDIKFFKSLLEKKKLIFQNSKFDYQMLKAAGINIDVIYDTMLGECVLYCLYQRLLHRPQR